MDDLTILIYEQERIVAEDIRRKIHSMMTSRIEVTHSINTLFQYIERNTYDLLILDIMLQFDARAEKFQGILDQLGDIPVIILSSLPSPVDEELLPRHEQMKVLHKPIDFAELRCQISALMGWNEPEECTGSNPGRPVRSTGPPRDQSIGTSNSRPSEIRSRDQSIDQDRTVDTSVPIHDNDPSDQMPGNEEVSWYD